MLLPMDRHEMDLGPVGIEGNAVYTIVCGDFTAVVHDGTALSLSV